MSRTVKKNISGETRFEQVKQFFAQFGYTPCARSADPEEHLLGVWLNNTRNRPGALHDEVRRWYNEHKSAADPVIWKRKILEFMETHKRRPSVVSTDLNERVLQARMNYYLYSYPDEAFGAQVEALVPGRYNHGEPWDVQVLQFVRKWGRRPRVGSADPCEHRLASHMRDMISPSISRFNRELRDTLDALCPNRQATWAQDKQNVLVFVRVYRRRPSAGSKDPHEANLGRRMNHCVAPKDASYDPAFVAELSILCPRLRSSIARNKAACLTFTRTYQRRPLVSSEDPEEARLAKCLANYLWAHGPGYDPAFAAQLDAVCPAIGSGHYPRKKKRN